MMKLTAVAAATLGAALFVSGVPARALEPCVTGCAALSVPADTEIPMGAVKEVRVTFQQGAGDGQANQQGNDDVAALAFTLGMPGNGSGAPVVLPCSGGRLAEGAVRLLGSAASNFAVVVENAECAGRERCLCPEGEQQRDDFINIAVYGPKNLPEGGPVQIPELPSGELIALQLKSDADENTVIPLHFFCEQDNGTPSKPQFAANLSLGDQSAVDQTANRAQDRSQVNCGNGELTVVEGIGCACIGDCDGNGAVSINELIRGVNIALELQPVANCSCADPNSDGRVTINELIQAVNRALNGCS